MAILELSVRRLFFPSGLSLALCAMMGIGLLSCGKVTQISNPTEEVKSFDLSYAIEGIPTSATTVYVSVVGFQKNSKQKEGLSWGRAQLKPFPKGVPFLVTAASGNVTPKRAKYLSVAYNKQGNEIPLSDHTWSKLDWEDTSSQWKGLSKKIDKKYPFYLVQFFSDKNRYAMKSLDGSVVTGNKVWNLGVLTPYDTFLSILLLIQCDQSSDPFVYKTTLDELGAMFSQSFFQTLGYVLPENQVNRFDPTDPVFVWDRKCEMSLIKIFNWAHTDKESALTYLQQLPPEVLSSKSKECLSQCIRKFSPTKTQ